MQFERIELTPENLMEVLTDKRVYVIYKTYSGEFRMQPIKETEVKELLSGKCIVCRIQ